MIPERRESERLAVPFEALVYRRGRDGPKRRLTAVVVNVSGGGAYMRMNETFEPGERVLLLFRMSGSGQGEPYLAARGRVVRAEEYDSVTRGIAVQFTSYRFL